jgi:hypothetical protein
MAIAACPSAKAKPASTEPKLLDFGWTAFLLLTINL